MSFNPITTSLFVRLSESELVVAVRSSVVIVNKFFIQASANSLPLSKFSLQFVLQCQSGYKQLLISFPVVRLENMNRTSTKGAQMVVCDDNLETAMVPQLLILVNNSDG